MAHNESVQSRYVYQKGKGVLWGSRFTHSTEPGKSLSGRPQVYLCFQFGSDKKEHWDKILETINYQSRFVMAYDGVMRPTDLGRACHEDPGTCARALLPGTTPVTVAGASG